MTTIDFWFSTGSTCTYLASKVALRAGDHARRILPDLGEARRQVGLHAGLLPVDEPALGIFGSLTFAIGRKLFRGDDRLDDAITWSRHGSLQP